MKVARLWNQHGAFCREWRGESLGIFPFESFPILHLAEINRLNEPTKTLAVLVLNGHSLVIEDETEEEE